VRGVHHQRDHLSAEFERARSVWHDQTAIRFQQGYLLPMLAAMDRFERAQTALVEAIEDAERIVQSCGA
jgi:hypothetical protein